MFLDVCAHGMGLFGFVEVIVMYSRSRGGLGFVGTMCDM